MSKLITIDSRLVDVVRTMRQAQKQYFEMANDRTGKYSQHQRTRALQAAKVAEKRVDEWIQSFLKESRAWYAEQSDYTAEELPTQLKMHTDEEPGLYDVERDR